jgi:uncharacterized protein (TIGR02594 family)
MTPKWLEHAYQDKGLKEIPGAGANPRIVQMHSHTTLSAESDEISWCSSGMNCWFDEVGIPGTHLANARSWLPWGVPLDKPVLGCVVILKRGPAPQPGPEILDAPGHVTLCSHEDIANGIIRCFGCNQGDTVKNSRFAVSDVLGYRWPEGIPIPQGGRE